ncbi:MAG: hypothetical protein AAGA33_07515 [Pseudomonadota bacterium]
MTQQTQQSLPDRIYRAILVVAAAVVFGVLVYGLLPDVKPYVGETGAAIWSWALIIGGGITAHRFLPRADLSPVSRVLFSVLSSALVAVFAGLILVLTVLPIELGEIPAVLLSFGLSAIAFAGVVFVPLHRVGERLGGRSGLLCLLAGAVIPAITIMVIRPVDPRDFVGDLAFAVFVAVIGACSAIGFSIASAWSGTSRLSES